VRSVLGVSERRACRTLGQARSTQRRVPKLRPDETVLSDAVVRLARQYGRYGYRRITAWLADRRLAGERQAGGAHLAARGAEGAAAAAEAGPAVAERRLLRSATAMLAWACLGLRLCPGPDQGWAGIPNADGDR
jgi:hypothetical protein